MSCPICHKPSISTFAPFCSGHCRNMDLLKWLNEDYKIPAESVADDEEVDEVPN